MSEHDSLKQAILDSARHLVEENIIVGRSIVADNITVVPIFRATVGIASGGNSKEGAGFAGGGAGLTVTPVTFIVIGSGGVKVLPAGQSTSFDRLIDATPALIDKLNGLLRKEGKSGSEPSEAQSDS